MKITQIIEELEKIKQKEGDLLVSTFNGGILKTIDFVQVIYTCDNKDHRVLLSV